MKSSSIQNKTIRPGSLNGYSYYHSNRKTPVATARPKSRSLPKLKPKFIIGLLFIAAIIGLPLLRSGGDSTPQSTANQTTSSARSTQTPATTPVQAPENNCEGNSFSKLIKVSIAMRHLWACEGAKTVYDAPVITGLENHPETETPHGTYHVYAKQQNTTLKGQDSRGAWSYPVYYWMPFLDNQYGTYGFHDATWRAKNAFGNIDPASNDASHGCVELSRENAKWLYEWAPVKTSVSVES